MEESSNVARLLAELIIEQLRGSDQPADGARLDTFVQQPARVYFDTRALRCGETVWS
jgi:hypothetical protein